MALRFAGIDPGTNGDHCPAMFVDEETGDFVFQGWTVTDPAALADVARLSPIADSESVVRLPARMRQIILAALSGQAAVSGMEASKPHWPAALEGDTWERRLGESPGRLPTIGVQRSADHGRDGFSRWYSARVCSSGG